MWVYEIRISLVALSLVSKIHQYGEKQYKICTYVCSVVQCPRHLGFPCGQLPIRRASVCPELLAP